MAKIGTYTLQIMDPKTVHKRLLEPFVNGRNGATRCSTSFSVNKLYPRGHLRINRLNRFTTLLAFLQIYSMDKIESRVAKWAPKPKLYSKVI